MKDYTTIINNLRETLKNQKSDYRKLKKITYQICEKYETVYLELILALYELNKAYKLLRIDIKNTTIIDGQFSKDLINDGTEKIEEFYNDIIINSAINKFKKNKTIIILENNNLDEIINLEELN